VKFRSFINIFVDNEFDMLVLLTVVEIKLGFPSSVMFNEILPKLGTIGAKQASLKTRPEYEVQL